MNTKDKSILYPKYIIDGAKSSIKEADEGVFFPYKGVREMLDIDKKSSFKKNKKQK